jgi:hypothetical protein
MARISVWCMRRGMRVIRAKLMAETNDDPVLNLRSPQSPEANLNTCREHFLPSLDNPVPLILVV